MSLFAAWLLVLCMGMECFTEMARAEKRKVEAGVVLNLDSDKGKMELTAITMALSDLYASLKGSAYTTRLHLHVNNSKGDVVLSAALAFEQMKNVHVPAILGPSTSMEAAFISELCSQASVPVISFSATSPSLSPSNNPFFIRAAPDDSSQARAITALVKAFPWRAAVLIYIDTEYGAGILPSLVDALQWEEIRVSRTAIPPNATDVRILEELHKLKNLPTRVFIVHTTSHLGARLFSKASEAGMMGDGFAWFVTDGVADALESMDHSFLEASMQGVVGVRAHRTAAAADFTKRWRVKFAADWPNDTAAAHLNIAGLRAYDAVMAVADAVEKVHFTKPSLIEYSTDLKTPGVSQAGPWVKQEMRTTCFKGLSGNFCLVDGQLPSPVLEIVNIHGRSFKVVGFWTQEKGPSRELSLGSGNLRLIIWPGDRTSPPMGWKRLKIGVPKKDGFTEFVRVTKDSNNRTKVGGYCIDVFNAVMKSLGYSDNYDFIPFHGTYDDLIYQVYLQKFDAVVGDTTILANRSNFVDFSLPFTESGVSMIVPYADADRKNNLWVFLKPLTWELWLTTFGFFILVGFVIWVLEHRINDDFRGPPSHQAGTIFWFSFSTMVFSHREKVVSKLGRFVIIVWVFVVLILTQSYTASLTSILTVQQLQPSETDIDQIQKRGEFVGYQQGSFVLQLLQRKNFHKSKLKVYNSAEQLHDALTRGTANGGVAAAIDEVPFLKIIMAKHCSDYTMVQQIFKTDGFGFAFPQGSPLVWHVSRAVLKVKEGKLGEIQSKWLGVDNCSAAAPMVDSGRLGVDSFKGLFIIAGATLAFALLAFVGAFVLQNRDLLERPFQPQTLLICWIRRFNERDLTSHNFRPPTTAAPDPSLLGGQSQSSLKDSAGPTNGTSPPTVELIPTCP